MKITYENKVNTRQSSTPRINRGDADDFNEIKTVVNTNANINEYSTSEQKIGKWGDKDLYRKTEIMDFSDLEFDGNETDIGFEFGNAYQLWIDFSHSFFEYTISNTGEYVKVPLNYIPFNATDNYTSVRNKTISVLRMSQHGIIIFVGNTMKTDLQTYNAKLHLSCEYTKE